MPCSGIHRSLGTHITQVRSVDLDKWKPEWVEVMKAWGNAKANAVWEAKMPKGYEGKPNETEAQELTPKLQKFIRDKYEKKKWYSASAARRMSQGKSDSEDEGEEETSNKDEPSKKPASKPSVSTTSTAKKPVIVMSTASKTTSTAPSVKAAPSAKPAAAPAVDNLLDTFDPFGDSSFEPSFPSSAPVVSQGVSVPDFAGSQFVTAAAPAAPASAPAKPALDLSSLYGMSAPSAPGMSPGMSAWGQMQAMPSSQPTGYGQFANSQQAPPQPSFAMGQAPFGNQTVQQGFMAQPQQSPIYPGTSPYPAISQPSQGFSMQMPQQQAFTGYAQPQSMPPQASPSAWPAIQPMQPMTQSGGAWSQPPVASAPARPTQQPPVNDPFAGLF